MEVEAEVVEEKEEEKKEEEEKNNNSDKIEQPSPGRWGKKSKHGRYGRWCHLLWNA